MVYIPSLLLPLARPPYKRRPVKRLDFQIMMHTLNLASLLVQRLYMWIVDMLYDCHITGMVWQSKSTFYLFIFFMQIVAHSKNNFHRHVRRFQAVWQQLLNDLISFKRVWENLIKTNASNMLRDACVTIL
jgi:hypothetical protein